MNGFNILKRLPKKPLLGLALLAVALGAAVGGAAKHADAAGPYTIEVTWDHVRWSSIDDGVFDHTAEVYGVLAANNYVGSTQYRTLGNFGNNSCSAGWTSTSGALCNKKVEVGTNYFFSQTLLSLSKAADQSPTAYHLNNNKLFVTMNPGQLLGLDVHLSDYDGASGNDIMCNAGQGFTFTDAELQSMNTDKTLQSNTYNAGDGRCAVVVHLRRI